MGDGVGAEAESGDEEVGPPPTEPWTRGATAETSVALLPGLRIGVGLAAVSSRGSEDAASGGHFLASFPIRYTTHLTFKAAVRDAYLDCYREVGRLFPPPLLSNKESMSLGFFSSRFETDRSFSTQR